MLPIDEIVEATQGLMGFAHRIPALKDRKMIVFAGSGCSEDQAQKLFVLDCNDGGVYSFAAHYTELILCSAVHSENKDGMKRILR